jgi:diaminohydroxyphosphoribosylaminopyrimidine deaminase/5-amino-6-(5-phosphoribosylamino)uracil reductase
VTARREWTARERKWMAQSLALGAQSEGRTSPNPRVGCLVVRDDRVVGRGFHRAPGEPHAEAIAIEEAGELARGATLYVNLEPCAHHGRTPPCVDLIVLRGIRRVVASIQDPNPLVDGKGFDRLREAGIAVDVGLLEDDARKLNEPFFHWHVHGRPLVTVKAALSADGMLSADSGESRWITGPLARRYAHRLRLVHDAILVGAETVRRDDPRLTVRLENKVVVRRRVVVTRSLDLDPEAKIFTEDGPPTRVYTTETAAAERGRRLAGRAEIVAAANGDDGVSLEAVLEDLGALGVQSVLVEGGSRTLSGFVNAGLAQRAALFYAGKLLGARGGTPFLDEPTVSSPEAGWRVRHDQLVPLGPDLLVVGRLRPPRRGG